MNNNVKKPSLRLFSTTRAVREFITSFAISTKDDASKNKATLAPKAMSVADFFMRAILVPSRRRADESECLLAMRAACDIDGASRLNIPLNFYEFLKDSEYLFSFFCELAASKKRPEDIAFADIYASFEEHVAILCQILSNYKEQMAKKGLFDAITMPEIYTINEPFVAGFGEIVYEIDGFLSEFDFEVLSKVAALTRLKVRFVTSKFNENLLKRFRPLLSEKLELGYSYELELAAQSSLDNQTQLIAKSLITLGATGTNRLITARPCAQPSLEAAFIFEKISNFIKDGIAPERIAVILPDESFAPILMLYDFFIPKSRMLSFAMGISFTQSRFCGALNALVRACENEAFVCFDDDYLSKSETLDELSASLAFWGVKKQSFDEFRAKFDMVLSFDEFSTIILSLSEYLGNTELVKKELASLRLIVISARLRLKELAHLLLSRLAKLSIDDTSGGAIRVLGLLESRGLSFDAVIIASFNDDVVPKRSVNEQFLSSAVRARAGLVSYFDRENLQRFYYLRLINEAKHVAVCYIQNQEQIASRFLKSFSVINDSLYSDEDYLELFNAKKPIPISIKTGEISDISLAVSTKDKALLNHDFFAMALSFTRFDTFLSCPRKYFYRYIVNLSEPRSLGKEAANEYGIKLHSLLKLYYEKPENADKFIAADFAKLIDSSDLSPLKKQILILKSQEYESLIAKPHFNDGWLVKGCELELGGEFYGAKIKGVIDRLDVRDGELFVIDYKSGGVKEDSLQLAFYAALLLSSGKASDISQINGAFYSFAKMRAISPKHDMTTALEQLKSELDMIKEYFKSPTYAPAPRDSTACAYCPYLALCKGEI